jgi:methyl-accepting chemotaxis protein
MKNWKITSRIWGILTLALVVGVFAGGFLFLRLNTIVAAYERLFDQNVRDQDLSRVMQLTFKKEVQEWKDVLLRGRDPAALKKYSDGFHQDAQAVRGIGQRLKGSIDDEQASRLLDQFMQAHQTMLEKYDAALSVFSQSNGAEQAAADAMVKGQDRIPTDLIDQIVTALAAQAGTRRAAITNSLGLFGLVLCILFALVIGASVLVVRSITTVLGRAVEEVRESAEQVSSAAAQLSSTGSSLAQGTSEQAASLEETSAAAEELASMTSRNAENSKTSNKLIAVVDSRVAEANQSLGEMMKAMEGITSSSSKIAKIIKVIDEIAFQTNVLALNAAVEAARAGAAGQGFAVVADEVRNLAQRSAQAAKQTEELIQESVVMSKGGSDTVTGVVNAIHSITESTAKVRSLVEEVNQGGQEQANGIRQIAKAVAEMQRVTQQSAAGAQESAAAGEELSAQAETMREIVVRLGVLVDGGRAA